MSWSGPLSYPPPPPPPGFYLPPVPPRPPLNYQQPDQDFGPPPAPTGKVVAVFCWTLIWLLAIALLTLNTLGERRIKAKPAVVSATPSAEFAIAGKMAVDKAAKAAAADASEKAVLTTESDNSLKAAGDVAKTPADRLAMVAVYYEARGKTVALDQLKKETPGLAATPALEADAELLRTIYTKGPASVEPDDQEKLKKQLGWFGELAVTQNQNAPDWHRVELLSQAGNVQTGLIVLGVGTAGVGMLGVIALVFAIVLLATGILRPTLVRPSPGGPPRMLVMFTIWFYGFVGNMILIELLIPKIPIVLHEFMELVWTGVVVWLMSIRGTTWTQWRRTIGLHSGQGIPLEMACGLGGYVAGLPLVFMAFLVTFALIKISGAQPTSALDDDLIGKLTPLKIFGLWLTAGVMAPLIEELVFRGALYGHLRRRWNAVISASVVGLIFAMIHPQGWTVIPVLATIGFVLAMLREWRGSLVASFTAHGVHNTAIVIIAVVMLH
jgi:membrane protease YdiL (CAAX protease family)